MVETFNTLVASGVLLILVFILVTIIAWVTKSMFATAVARNAHIFLRVIFVASMVGSLTYELVFGYEPCLLCWYQRMAIFPLAILFFTADIRTSALLRTQTIVLASIGLAFALFHIYIDVFPNSGVDVCGTGPSCLLRYVNEFGFITVQVMSATVLFTALIVSFLVQKYPKQ